MANSVDPDQTAPLGAVWSAPLGAVWSGSALFAQAYLSKNLGSLWYESQIYLACIIYTKKTVAVKVPIYLDKKVKAVKVPCIWYR